MLGSFKYSEIKSKNSALKSGFSGNYNYSNGGSEVYYFIAYPESWSNISSWVDSDTGFGVDYTQATNVDITNSYGVTVTYKVFRTTYKQTSDLHSSIS